MKLVATLGLGKAVVEGVCDIVVGVDNYVNASVSLPAHVWGEIVGIKVCMWAVAGVDVGVDGRGQGDGCPFIGGKADFVEPPRCVALVKSVARGV